MLTSIATRPGCEVEDFAKRTISVQADYIANEEAYQGQTFTADQEPHQRSRQRREILQCPVSAGRDLRALLDVWDYDDVPGAILARKWHFAGHHSE